MLGFQQVWLLLLELAQIEFGKIYCKENVE